jgi:hypothetical protein
VTSPPLFEASNDASPNKSLEPSRRAERSEGATANPAEGEPLGDAAGDSAEEPEEEDRLEKGDVTVKRSEAKRWPPSAEPAGVDDNDDALEPLPPRRRPLPPPLCAPPKRELEDRCCQPRRAAIWRSRCADLGAFNGGGAPGNGTRHGGVPTAARAQRA